MPDILKQVGPQQYQFLKAQLGNSDQKSGAAANDDEDVPELVGTFEDAGKKQQEENKQEQPSQEASASLTKASLAAWAVSPTSCGTMTANS